MLRAAAREFVDDGACGNERDEDDQRDQEPTGAGAATWKLDRRQDCPERKSLSAAGPGHDASDARMRTCPVQVREAFFADAARDPANG
jgi:hypothetical protein